MRKPVHREAWPPVALSRLLGSVRGVSAGPFESAELIAPGPGAYALAIRIAETASVTIARRVFRLDPADYVYLGNAGGPGGLHARLRRHFAADKRPHWNVDRLTIVATALAAWTSDRRSECELTGSLLETGHFREPIQGFGSSDCKTCRSHLLEFEPRGRLSR